MPVDEQALADAAKVLTEAQEAIDAAAQALGVELESAQAGDKDYIRGGAGHGQQAA